MTPLWINDLSILYKGDYLFEIIPNKNFDFNRKLNSLVRLSIYYSCIMYFVNGAKITHGNGLMPVCEFVFGDRGANALGLLRRSLIARV